MCRILIYNKKHFTHTHNIYIYMFVYIQRFSERYVGCFAKSLVYMCKNIRVFGIIVFYWHVCTIHIRYLSIYIYDSYTYMTHIHI